MMMRLGLPLLDVSFVPGLGSDARRHFRNQAAVVGETARVLRHGGRFIIVWEYIRKEKIFCRVIDFDYS